MKLLDPKTDLDSQRICAGLVVDYPNGQAAVCDRQFFIESLEPYVHDLKCTLVVGRYLDPLGMHGNGSFRSDPQFKGLSIVKQIAPGQ